jgi:hypothetical protein
VLVEDLRAGDELLVRPLSGLRAEQRRDRMPPRVSPTLQVQSFHCFLGGLLRREAGPFTVPGGQGAPCRGEIGFRLSQPVEMTVAHAAMLAAGRGEVKTGIGSSRFAGPRRVRM